MKIQLAIAICENYIFNHQKHSAISCGNISNAKFRSGCNLGLDNANWVSGLDVRVFGENFIEQKLTGNPAIRLFWGVHEQWNRC